MINQIRERVNNYRLNCTHKKRAIDLHKKTPSTFVEHLLPTVSYDKKWYGTSYGGFYVHPHSLNKQPIVYSFGIGKDISFDMKCIKKHDAQVYAFDPTPKSVQWVKKQKTPPQFRFYNYGISYKENGLVNFYLPKNEKAVSGSILLHNDMAEHKGMMVQMKNFKTIIQELGHTYIDILKMDIEGAEYDVLASILDSPVEIGQILVEFHDRFFDMHQPKSMEIVKKLQAHGYQIFAHSTGYEEVSFIKVD